MKPNFESIQDTCLDIANYAIILKMQLEDKWVEDKIDTKRNFSCQVSGMLDLFERKLLDYGTKDLIEVGAGGIMSRMVDKFARLKNLMTDEQTNVLVESGMAKNFSAPKKKGDVGYDLTLSADLIIAPHSQVAVDLKTGVKVKVPTGTWGLIINRSSTPRKKGLIVMPGVIDEGYIGELFACVFNTTDNPIEVKMGERLAQLILLPAVVRGIEEVEKLPETERGETGFGSTNI